MVLTNQKNLRYYLSGVDWTMAALNKLNKDKTGIGNHSQLILVLNGYLEKQVLSKKLSTALQGSCFLKGKTKRAWHLAPYWSPEISDFNLKTFRYFNLKKKSESAVSNVLQQCAVTLFTNNMTLLNFDLIHNNNLTYLIMRFDHRVLDARGAEALLDNILYKHDSTDKNANTGIHDSDDQNDNPKNNFKPNKNYKPDKKVKASSLQLPASSANLHSWKSKFLSGQKINRFLRSVYPDKTKIASMERDNSTYNKTEGKHRFYLASFSEYDTLKIDANAMKKAGYLMNGIFLLSAVVKSFSLILKEQKKEGELLIPINVDVREAKFSKNKIFFNNVSFMLFKLKPSIFSLSETIESLKQQFISQAKDKITYHFINASSLMRIMPLVVLSKFMGHRMKKNQTSFSFSYIAQQAFNLKKVAGHEVLNLFHMPIVPYNPGIGIFFTRFNKKLNMVISGFDSKFDSKKVENMKINILYEILNTEN